MKRILITTDFSVASEKAVRYTLGLLSNHACEITFFHAYYSFPSDSASESSFSSFEAVYSRSKDNMRKFIDSFEQTDIRQIHLFRSLLLPASPAGAMRFLSCQHDFDLIVAGTKARRNDIFFGNIGTDIVRNVPANAIIVPENVCLAPIKNIVLAIDTFTNCSFSELATLKAILLANKATLTLLTVIKTSLSEKIPDTLPTYDYHYYFKGIEIVDYPVSARNLEEGVMKYLSFHEADMLVTVSRQRSLLGELFNRSLMNKMALNPIVPYMSIFSKSTETVINKEIQVSNQS
jgi:nucleotide-binding universal stress UspA family protein